MERRIALAQRIITDEIRDLSDRSFNLAGDWFGGGLSDREQSRRLDEEVTRLQTALKQLERDATNLHKLKQQTAQKPADFYRKLRELEGSELDGPLNFAWRIDFPHVLSGGSTATLADELALVNRAQRQQELTNHGRAKLDSGFDLIVGNPPFVTARNKEKRELYRERWPRVCHMKFLLVCPFFEMSFSLLRPDGQLGFIVSNAFAKREFGKPLVRDFFPTVDLQKVIDCSGLMFPGHGTPTCIVFGAQRKPDERSPIRVAAILPGGGDLRTPPEESPLWHTLAAYHDDPGFSDAQVIVAERPRREMAKHPWNSDVGSEILRVNLEQSPERLTNWCRSVGICFFTNAEEVFLVSADFARRINLSVELLTACQTGDDIRDWSSSPSCLTIRPYDNAWKPINLLDFPSDAAFLQLFRKPLGARATFSGKTYDEEGKLWYG
jgi:hypothetical protein